MSDLPLRLKYYAQCYAERLDADDKKFLFVALFILQAEGGEVLLSEFICQLDELYGEAWKPFLAKVGFAFSHHLNKQGILIRFNEDVPTKDEMDNI